MIVLAAAGGPLDQVQTLLGIAGAIIGLLAYIVRLSSQVGRLMLQMDTLWDMFIKRAQVEMVETGWGKHGSDISVTPLAYQRLLPYLPQMNTFYRTLRHRSPNIREADVLTEFSRQFGAQLYEDIALQDGISPTVILVAAVKLCEADWAQHQPSPIPQPGLG